MEIKKYTTANKEAWNEVIPKHQIDLPAGHGEIQKLNAGIPLGLIILAEKL